VRTAGRGRSSAGVGRGCSLETRARHRSGRCPTTEPVPRTPIPCTMLGRDARPLTINSTLGKRATADYATNRAEQRSARARGQIIASVGHLPRAGVRATTTRRRWASRTSALVQRAACGRDRGSATVFTASSLRRAKRSHLAQLGGRRVGLAIDAVRVVHGNTELQR